MFNEIVDNDKLFVIHEIEKFYFNSVLFFVVVVIIINKERRRVLKINKILKFNRVENDDDFTNQIL